jgi:hypothetical protein
MLDLVEEEEMDRELKSLRAENERLRSLLERAGEVLHPFAIVADAWDETEPEEGDCYPLVSDRDSGASFSAGDLFRARALAVEIAAALKEESK